MAQSLDSSTVIEASVSALITRLANDLQKTITATLAQQERFTWVLSGGNTPRQLFQRLTGEPYRSAIPWQRLWIFWGDERPVPPTHPESNFRMAQEALLSQVPIPAAQIFRFKGELPPDQAARDYEQQLKTIFSATLPVFDLILLGMGPDGHTASLFPGTDALMVKNRFVVDNAVPQLKTTRLTFTLPILNHARAVWFLATGADKAAAYANVRRAPNAAYPASLVLPSPGTLTWYIDASIQNG